MGELRHSTSSRELMDSPRVHEFLQEMHREVMSKCEHERAKRCKIS